MLGEGARTAEDAARYYDAYADAIEKIGRAEQNSELADRAGISVKLSALHPRYDALGRERIMRELRSASRCARAQRHEPRIEFYNRCGRGRPS